MPRLGPFVILAVLIVLLASPVSSVLAQEGGDAAAPQDRHCPDNPSATFTFLEKPSQIEQDRKRLKSLADVARHQRLVCILSLVDPVQLQQRHIAIRRVKWVMEQLIDNGVPRNIIAIELRPQDADPDAMRLVQVIFGK